jgi:hypothetical protein
MTRGLARIRGRHRHTPDEHRSHRVPKHDLAAVSLICVSVDLAACSSDTAQGKTAPPSASSAPALDHVHGLGVNPADDTLYIASHSGVYQVTQDGAVERVADRYQDTMGFAVVGPGNFLASGHPDLIESNDAAKTWTALSLIFHV